MRDNGDDDDVVVKHWRKFNPYFHVIGFIVLCVFIGTMKYAKMDAYGEAMIKLDTRNDKQDERIAALEMHYARIDATLQDMRDYFHIPRHDRIADGTNDH